MLVVDPLSFCRREVREVLEPLGYRVAEASSLEEAWELFTELEPDVVVLEILLPDGDGLELIRRAKKEKRSARFIVLSAACGEEEVRAAVRQGAEDFLAKPLDPRRLEMALGGRKCSA